MNKWLLALIFLLLLALWGINRQIQGMMQESGAIYNQYDKDVRMQ